MTSASLLRVLEGLISGRLLSRGQLQLMDGSCLGWDCSIARLAGYRGKYGGSFVPSPAAGLQIFFGILAGTIPVVIATNSNGPPPLQAVVQTALRAAASPR
jgi:hypothetical protein